MTRSRPDDEKLAASAGKYPARPLRHTLREQDSLWDDFLRLAATVVESLDKSVQAVCEGRFDLIADVENEEEEFRSPRSAARAGLSARSWPCMSPSLPTCGGWRRC